MGLNKRLINTGGAGIDATEYFDVGTYTGSGATRTITTGFETDFIWFNRNNNSVGFYDSARPNYRLDPATGNGIQTLDAAGVTSFNSDGFTLGSSGVVNASSGWDYVYWAWKGGTPTTGSGTNTNSVTMRASPESGFSLVRYVPSGYAPLSFTHGLDSAPEFVIIKNYNDTNKTYQSQFTILGEDSNLRIGSSGPVFYDSATNNWMRTTDSEKVYVGRRNEVSNANYYEMVAYCFHSVPGYQKIGTYTGDGTSNNSITGLGFQPRFLLLKRYDDTGYWSIFDSANGPSVRNFVEIANGQQTGTSFVSSFDASGFTLGTAAEFNIDTANYVYLAIA